MKYTLSSVITFIIMMGCSSSIPKVEASNVTETKHEIVKPMVKVKQESPIEIAKKSCLAENSQGCIDFGYILIENKEYKLAKTAFMEAFHLGDKDGAMRGQYYVECLENNAESCNLLGYVLENGKGGKQDYELARVAYQQSIDLGNTDSLGSLAHLYDKGLGGERSYFKATKLFEQSCNAGTTDVNYENCYNTGYNYSKGKGVRQDNFKTVKFYQKACSGGYADGCGNLGWMYDYGKGVRQSKSTALMYYGKACDLGSDLGCTNYAKSNK